MNFIEFNQKLIEQAIDSKSKVILTVDCSFLAKSGKRTYGLDYFYNGSVSRTEKGLEISAMAVIDISKKHCYSLSVQQRSSSTNLAFSMASYKRRARREAVSLGLNYHLLERFIDGEGRAGFPRLSNRHVDKLDLDPTLIKSHPNYSNLHDYVAIAA